MNELHIFGIYKHFKGNYYIVLGTANDCENENKLVLYRALYGTFENWVRPIEEFLSEVDHEKYPDVKQKYRFEYQPNLTEEDAFDLQGINLEEDIFEDELPFNNAIPEMDNVISFDEMLRKMNEEEKDHPLLYAKQLGKAYAHEYEQLVKGEISAMDIPRDALPGIIYRELNRMVSVQLTVMDMEAALERTDIMMEENHFEFFLDNPEKLVKDKEFLEEMLLGEAAETRINRVYRYLDMAEVELETYGQAPCENLELLLEQLLLNDEQAFKFFGSESACDKVRRDLKKGVFFEHLLDIISYIPSPDTVDVVEMIVRLYGEG